MPSDNDRNTSTGDDATPPSSNLEDVLDVLTLAPSPSSAAANITNGMHFVNGTVADLGTDELAIILSFLDHNEIMRARVLCTIWRDAAKKTLVSSYFEVRSYNALRSMSSALPNLQGLLIRSFCLDGGSKYADGEDPDEEYAARTAHYTTHDPIIISNFRKLRLLDINDSLKKLNGGYPFLFNFPLLQSLTLTYCWFKWDLDMLSGCPLLRELRLSNQRNSTGNLNSLRVLKLKSTLQQLYLSGCENVRGNFMELADFPRLKKLWIYGTMTGDVRHIQEDDFPSLEELRLPSTVIGGHYYQFQRISDVPSFMHAIYPLLKRFPKIFNHESRNSNTEWTLSKGSADWYEYETEMEGDTFPATPFEVDCVLAGLRCGWRWSSGCYYYNLGNDSWQRSACEVNWLDPEPSEDSDGYERYVECLQKIEDQTDFYGGYSEPPTEEEYRRLCLRERED